MPGCHLRCVECDATYDAFVCRYRCECGGTLDVVHDFAPASLDLFDRRLASKTAEDRSGVWRFRELVLPIDSQYVVTRGEGRTNLYDSPRISEFTGVDDLRIKHEGENPTGSFKDRGMTVAMTLARRLGMNSVACASTGNTSASMASYAAAAGMCAFVFIPQGKIAYGKLSQALAYGALAYQIEGNFDDAMRLVEQTCRERDIYLVNSINPFRIEGQKAIGFELLQDLDWKVPDWIVLPGGNLGNNSAIAKGLLEMHELGLIDRLPRLAVIQAAGAAPLYRAFRDGGDVLPDPKPETLATAIRIGAPVSWRKSLRGIEKLGGVVEQVTDQEILDAKYHVDAAGIGAEPASCASIAGLRKLVEAGVIAGTDRVAAILTGNLLKDPDVVIDYHTGEIKGIRPIHANRPIALPSDPDKIRKALDGVMPA